MDAYMQHVGRMQAYILLLGGLYLSDQTANS
jgi:hypothetical protein